MQLARTGFAALQTLALFCCGGDSGEPAASSAPVPAASSPAAASAQPVVMANCAEATFVETICGKAKRCLATDLIQVEPSERPAGSVDICGSRLTQVWRELSAEVRSPSTHFERELPGFDEPSPCKVVRDSDRFAALDAVTARLRKRGSLAASALGAPKDRAHWSKEMAAFRLGDLRVSCLAGDPERFLLRVSTDYFGPAALPYWAIWSAPAANPSAVVPLYESSASAPEAWSAGDLDGDGGEEIIIHEAQHYALLDAKEPKPTLLFDGAGVTDVFGITLPSGPAVVIEGRALHYRSGAIAAAPAIATDELAAALSERSARAQTLLSMLGETLPPYVAAQAEACTDRARLGWAVAFARERARARNHTLARALPDAAELVGVRHCFEPTP